jgi:hypothetical protein
MIISLGAFLSLFEADTTIADVHGKELEILMTKAV